MNKNHLYFFFTEKWENVCKNVVIGCFGWFSACFVVFFIADTDWLICLGIIPVIITIVTLFIADQMMQYFLLDEISKSHIRAKACTIGTATAWSLLIVLIPSLIYLVLLCF